MGANHAWTTWLLLMLLVLILFIFLNSHGHVHRTSSFLHILSVEANNVNMALTPQRNWRLSMIGHSNSSLGTWSLLIQPLILC